MRLSISSLSVLVRMLYEAAADKTLWPQFLADLNHQIGAERGSLVTHSFSVPSTGRNEGRQLYQAGFSPEAVELYNQHYGSLDSYARGFSDRKVRSEVGYCADLVDYHALRREEFYNDFLRPSGTFYLCWIAVSGSGRATALSLARSEKRQPFDAEQLRVLTLLTPHLRQALKISRRIDEVNTAAASAKRTVEAFEIALLSVDDRGRVIHVSRAAEALLQKQSGLRLKNRRLVVADTVAQARLDSLLCGVIRTSTGRAFEEPFIPAKLVEAAGHRKVIGSRSSGGAVLIESQSFEAPMEVTVVPFRSETILQDESPAALVFLTGPGQTSRLLETILKDLYHLTPAEILLAVKVSQGKNIQTAADELCITRETARHRLKQVFHKTGVSRQPELVRLILAFPRQ